MDKILGSEGMFSLSYVVLIVIGGVVLIFFKRFVDGPRYKVPDVDLRGRVAVITGGNGGIGYQVAKEMALLGCRVIIGARNRLNA